MNSVYEANQKVNDWALKKLPTFKWFNFFSVKFEHGEVDPDSFQNWKSKFKIGLSESDRENNTEPQLKVKIKSDVTTYSSYAKSLDGKKN